MGTHVGCLSTYVCMLCFSFSISSRFSCSHSSLVIFIHLCNTCMHSLFDWFIQDLTTIEVREFHLIANFWYMLFQFYLFINEWILFHFCHPKAMSTILNQLVIHWLISYPTYVVVLMVGYRLILKINYFVRSVIFLFRKKYTYAS